MQEIATVPFARRGYRMLCIELGENLAAIAKQKLAIYPQVEVHRGAKVQWENENEEFYLRCKPIFDKVKAELIETHYNWFVAIEPDSAEYFIDKDSEVASLQCREKHPGKIPNVFRINETGACGTI